MELKWTNYVLFSFREKKNSLKKILTSSYYERAFVFSLILLKRQIKNEKTKCAFLANKVASDQFLLLSE